jgi:uncharacterized protein YbjQ (UPF0145 family)
MDKVVMSKALPVFTIQTFNQNALQPAGAVFAQRVESVSVARSFFSGSSGAAGGRNTLMEKKMNDLTKSLMEELDIQAKKMYPSAVALVNVQVHFSDLGNSDSNVFLAGQASATALIKRVKAQGQSMMPSSSAPMGSPMSAPMAAPMSAPMGSPMAAPMSAPMGSPVAAPMPALPSPSSPAASAAMALSPQNAKELVIPKAISGGKSKKRKSFISKSRKNRKQE